MRLICYLNIAFCLCMNVGVSKATTTLSSTFAGQWPYHSSKSIAMDSAKQLIYLGDGDTINILDSNLNFISSFVATETSQIGGLFYSTTDNLLYIACGTDGLKIYDITDPVNPLLVNSYLPDFESFDPDFRETLGVFIDGSKLTFQAVLTEWLSLILLIKKILPCFLNQNFTVLFTCSHTPWIYMHPATSHL